MDDERSADGANASSALYDWWFEALPALFGAAGERRGPNVEVPADAAVGKTTASATGRAARALELTQLLLDSLGGAWFGALVRQPAGAPLAAFDGLLRTRLAELAAQWDAMAASLAGPADVEAAFNGVARDMTNSFVAQVKPLVTNMELAFGGLADAFGLAPLRELEGAGRELAIALLAKRRAQAAYLQVALDAARQSVDALTARLVEMGQRGESVDTVLALVRLGANTLDRAMHEAMQSPRALEAAAEAIRATLGVRRQQQRIVAVASEALNVPTRAEVDEAYREIQELKREVRRLRKSAAPARDEAPSPSVRPSDGPRGNRSGNHHGDHRGKDRAKPRGASA